MTAWQPTGMIANACRGSDAERRLGIGERAASLCGSIRINVRVDLGSSTCGLSPACWLHRGSPGANRPDLEIGAAVARTGGSHRAADRLFNSGAGGGWFGLHRPWRNGTLTEVMMEKLIICKNLLYGQVGWVRCFAPWLSP